MGAQQAFILLLTSISAIIIVLQQLAATVSAIIIVLQKLTATICAVVIILQQLAATVCAVVIVLQQLASTVRAVVIVLQQLAACTSDVVGCQPKLSQKCGVSKPYGSPTASMHYTPQTCEKTRKVKLGLYSIGGD